MKELSLTKSELEEFKNIAENQPVLSDDLISHNDVPSLIEKELVCIKEGEYYLSQKGKAFNQKMQYGLYNLSKDYKSLYSHLCEGKIILGFVNYNFSSLEGKYPPSRDLCKIRRRKSYDIDFGARGISYGSVSDYHNGKESEYDVFLSECNRMDVEWICEKPTTSLISDNEIEKLFLLWLEKQQLPNGYDKEKIDLLNIAFVVGAKTIRMQTE